MNLTLVEALKAKFGKVKVHGDWISIPCPTCAPKDRQKMKRGIHINAHTSSCFICGIKQDVSFLLDSIDYIPSTVVADYEEEDKGVDPRALILPYCKGIPVNNLGYDHPAIQFLHKDYLFDLDTYANQYKIVYVPFEGGVVLHNGLKFITSAEHIIFPVYNEQKLVGWQMRSVPGTFYGNLEDDVRYYHLFNKGSYLYNYDQAKLSNRVIVVEGVKKALKFPNQGVATWGACISRKQLKLIQEWPEIIMMLDSDVGNNTQQRARGFVDSINMSGHKGRAINIDLGKYGAKSPDELPAEKLNEIVDKEWNK